MRFVHAAVFLSLCLPLAAAEPGFTPIFDGKTFNGWTLVERSGGGYEIVDGMIVSPEKGGGYLFTQKEYANFVLRFEFRLSPGGNNGIGIRAPIGEGNPSYTGMEIQILDHYDPMYCCWLKPAQHHGSIYGVVPAKLGYLNRAGEWNEEEIVADGSRIKVTLNGGVIVDADLSTVTDPAVLKEHPGIRRPSGHIGLLGHDSKVEFRNLRVKQLP
jgi:hypothetical protein